MPELTATQVADRLDVTRQHVLGMLRAGRIAGRRLPNGVWLVDSDAVARFELAAQRGSGRSLQSSTAWGLLWELSGLRADWLTESTRARVRRRIRGSSAEELTRAVSSRTTSHRYASANPERAQAGLIATGRAAADVLEVELLPDNRRVAGYVRNGTPDDYASTHFMVADENGPDVIYENTLPVDYDGETMPAAVVAVDLATSVDTRERTIALRVVEELRRAWLAGR